MNIVWLAGIFITVATAIPVVLQIRHHPRGLFVLFFAEMWERFSYYGMRGLLIFYLTQHFLFDDTFSQGQYGAYTSLAYLLPLLGGILADRVLGTRKAIAFGALLLVAGHFTMAIEGPSARQTLTYQGATYNFENTKGAERGSQLRVGDALYEYGPAAGGGLEIRGLPEGAPLPSVIPTGEYKLDVAERNPFYVGVFYLALSLIIVGVGFLKGNISTIVGQLYPQGDPRRDSGFTLYYYGINLGAFWASIACGWLGQHVGWWAGFGAAGLGMLAGYVVFIWGKPLLEGHGEPPDPERLRRKVLGGLFSAEIGIYLLCLLGVAFVFTIVQRQALVGWMLGAGSVLVLGYLTIFMVTKCTKVERDRLLLAFVLIAATVVFWTLFEQAGSSLNQFAERNTQLAITATESITAAQTQSFNAGFILILAPAFAALWAYLGQRNRDPNPVIKFGLALVLAGIGFFALVWGASFADAAYRVPLIFLLLAYLLHTTGELWISPVALSQMTKLAPAAVVATVMATWWLATAWGQWLAGVIAQMTAVETIGGEVLDPAAALATYVSVFRLIGFWGIGLGIVLLAINRWPARWAHGVNDTRPETLGGGEKAKPAVAARPD